MPWLIQGKHHSQYPKILRNCQKLGNNLARLQKIQGSKQREFELISKKV